jgi:hypothetical protein
MPHQFVHVGTTSDGQPAALSVADQRAIRSQAMKDFRRRQREATKASFRTSTASSTPTPMQQPTPAPDSCVPGNEAHPQVDESCQLTDFGRADSEHAPPSFSQTRSNSSPAACCIGYGAHSDTVSQPIRSGDHCNDCVHKRHALSRRTTLAVLPKTIRSPASIRGPMLQSHIEAFLPPCVWSSHKMMGVLRTWSIARSPATLHINDAIGLTHFGFVGKDHQLVMEGRKLHVKAVSSVRREINDPSLPIEIRASAVISMMMAETYSALSSGLAGCATHLSGVTALLHAHLSQPDAHPVDRAVLSQYNRVILLQGLIHRKAVPLDVRLTKYEDEFVPGSIEELIYLGLRLPPLIEITDRCHDKHLHRRYVNALSTSPVPEALSLGLKLDTWLRGYETGGFRYLKSPLGFRSSVDANVLGLYWSLRLLLAEFLYVWNLTSAPTATGVRAARLAEDEASMYAD